MSKSTKIENFEQSLEKLEGIVEKLESGSLSLSDSLKEFENGLKAYKDCKGLLQKAEEKIHILTESLDKEEYSLES